MINIIAGQIIIKVLYVMKKIKLTFVALLLSIFISMESCGPIIISSRPSHPVPNWFYPNRVVNVRYVYFPEYTVYYDLTLRNYIYLDNGIWLTVNVLPNRFSSTNFKKTKQIRINNYYGDNIRDYHRSNRVNIKGRRTSTSKTKTRRN